ncbi:MAG TPA: hypothetical protein VER11_28205 [Polyangiaceae bacterium]|nr:hypothetical protein [Polyangiaceae bacterium]
MRRVVRVAVVGALLGLLSAGCSSESDDTPAPKLGEACSGSNQCGEGTCAGAGVCTKTCDTHSECGCPPGTSNGDIVDGRCGLSCTDGECTRVCKSSLDCAGGTECVSGVSHKTCQ